MESRPISLIILVALLISAVAGESTDNCVYTMYVKTDSVIKGGTDSKIGVTLGDGRGGSVRVPDLEEWGLMGPTHDYYERGNVDIFSARGSCVESPLCRINVTSDGSGKHHGWYCDYVEVTSTGPHKECSQTIFYVDRWLASDAPPYSLTAVLDGCKMGGVGAEHRNGGGPLVVGNRKGSASE